MNKHLLSPPFRLAALVAAFIMTVILGSVALGQNQNSNSDQSQVSKSKTEHPSKKKKRRKKQNYKTARQAGPLDRQTAATGEAYFGQKSNGAPPGVATTLPAKHNVAETTTAFASPGTAGESNYAVAVANIPQAKATGVHANVEITTGFLNSTDAHVGNDTVSLVGVTPRVIWDLSETLSVYGQVPFSSFAPSQANTFNTIGRPELGAFQSFILDDQWSVGVGLTVKLPFYSLSGGDTEFVEPARVWQFAPGAAGDYTFPDGETHVLSSLKFAYDTNSTFSRGIVNNITNQNQSIDGLNRPVTAIGSLGVSHDSGNVTLGIAFHIYDWLGNGHITSGGQTFRDVPALSLNHGELFATYRFTQTTVANASLIKGFKTDADPSTFAIYDVPLEMSNTALSVGLTHVF